MFRFSGSQAFAAVSIIFYAFALVVVNIAELSIWIKVVLSVIVCCHLWLVLNRYGWLNSALSLQALWQDTNGRWVCQLQSGKRYTGKLWLSHCFISPFLLVVWLKGKWGRKCLLIPFDTLTNQEYRCLSYLIQV